MGEWGSGEGQIVKMKLSINGENTVIRKMKNVENAFGQVGTKMGTFNKSGRELSSTFTANATLADKMNKGMLGLATRFVGLQVAVGMTVGKIKELVEWMGESTKKFREFDNRIAEVSTILGGEAIANTDTLRIGIENLSKAYGKSANDLAEGSYQILSAAFEAKEALNLLNTATRASIAGLTDVATSVDVFTSILNSYGKTVAQAGQVSDILFQTVVRGKLRFEDLASAMGYITPIAANAGVAFEEIAAVLSTVTRMGLHVDMATRGLALGLQDIIDPTTAAAKAAREYEVDMSAVALRVKGLTGFVADLSEAMKDHGTSILPEMIRNMRSMRVFMALAGEEGVLGFAEDLAYLERAAGKTEEALAKMMNTAQMESDMLGQSMEYLERRVGEAWHGVDIWWRKTQLWWGTFLTGGDASKAMKEYETRIFEIRKNYYEMLKATTAISGQPTLFSQLIGGNGSALDKVDFSKIKEYFMVAGNIEGLANVGYNLSTAIGELNLEYSRFLASSQGTKELGDWLDYVRKVADRFGITLDENADFFITNNEAFKQVNDRLTEMSTRTDDAVASFTDLKLALEPTMNNYIAAFDDASEAINKHIENIYELEHAIKELNTQVVTPYTALSGDTYTGKLDYKMGLFEEETRFSRAQQYTNMAIKYGSEFINEYNQELEESIMAIHNYTEAQERMASVVNSNNIEILSLQIKGMKSRRGLNRAQEEQMKKLQIANMEARLESMKAEEEVEDDYKKSQRIIDEFFDRWAHNIFELKDIRNDELADMKADYAYKTGLVEEYTGLVKSEYIKLGVAQNAYLELLESANDTLSAEFRQTYGVEIPAEIQKSIDAIEEWADKAIAGGYSSGNTADEILSSGREKVSLDGIRKNDILGSHATGTEYIPKTGLYKLHRGEGVSPAGGRGRGNAGGSVVINNYNTINARVDSRYGTERLARDLAALQSSGVIRNLENDFSY